MSDDLSDRGPADAARVDISQPHELRYWTRTLGCSEQELRAAVAAVGEVAEEVREYFRDRTRLVAGGGRQGR
jgi:hypothetical protein